ncbi:MAG: MFS transporter [Deltaproteobacteria bacterium]|nr:MFS transporter [Deltaproteobacteria bacterium]
MPQRAILVDGRRVKSHPPDAGLDAAAVVTDEIHWDTGATTAARPHWRRALVLLWMGQVISHLGDSLYLVGIVWLVLDLTGSKALTGWLVAVNFAPALLLGLFAGAFVDRHDRRRIMISADILRFLAVGAIPILVLNHRLDTPVLGVILLALATGTTFFNPAIKALVPEIAPSTQLATAVTVFQLSEQVAFLGGPLLGQPATKHLGLVHLFTLDAATFLFSAICLMMLPSLGRRKSHAAATQTLPPLTVRWILAESRVVLRTVWASPVLRALLLLTALDNLFIMGPAYIATPVLVKETLHLGPEGYMSAMIFFFLGLTLGTAATWIWARRVPKGRLILLGIIFDGLTFIPFYFCRTLGQIQVALFIHALAIPLIIIPRTVLMQQSVPGRLHGRLFALVNVTVFGMTGVSAGLTGLVIERVAPATLFLIVGFLGAIPGLLAFRVRALRTAV